MRTHKVFYFSFFFLTILCSTGARAKLETFIGSPNAALSYYKNGHYFSDVSLVVSSAEKYLKNRLADTNSKHLAVVFDVDETLFSNFNRLRYTILGDTSRKRMKLKATDIMSANPVRLPAVYRFYKYCLRHNIAIFIITGEKDIYKSKLIAKLHKIGYKDWTKLIMRKKSEYNLPTTTYKTAMRRRIVGCGFDIVLSLSDQYVDLRGGCADNFYKLPNPFYYIS